MKKIKAYSFRVLLKIYRKFSHSKRKKICLVIKKTNLPHNSFYKELKFEEKFKVKLSKNKSFYLMNYGGSTEIEIFWKGLFTTWENDAGWIWIQVCQFCDVILDIGANKGIYSLVAKTINPNATIYAFEPSIYTFDKLKKNVEINNYNIQCESLAISNKTEDQIFYDLPLKNQTTASISPDKMKNFEGYKGEIIEYLVKTTTLTNYIEKNNIPKIDLIKLDIELHEPEAIEGMGDYLIKNKPIVLLEVLTEEIALKLNKLIDFNSFELFHLKKGAKAIPLSEFKTDEKSLREFEWNYILFHKELKEKMKAKTTLYNS